MTVPTPIQQRIRILDARGVSWRRISKEVGVSRQTVRKYAQLEDCSPEPPARPAAVSKLDPYKPLIGKWLEADRFMPRKQRHTARRVYDRLVEEQGFDGSYQIVQRYVKRWRQEHRLPGDGYLELEWSPGVMQADFGLAQAVVAGSRTDVHCLVASFPYSNMRYAVALPGENAECVCEGLLEVFEHIGAVPPVLVLDNATGAAHRVSWDRIVVVEVFQRFVAHHRIEVRFCNPGAGNEKGSVENAVGFLRRNVMVPLPNAESHAQLTRFMLSRCDRIAEDPHYRKGEPVRDLFARDREAMAPMPGTRFDACRWEVRKADGEGCVSVDSHRYLAGPSWRGWTLDVGLRAFDVEIRTHDGRRVGKLPRAYGGGHRHGAGSGGAAARVGQKAARVGREPHTRGFPRQAPAEHRRDGVQGAAAYAPADSQGIGERRIRCRGPCRRTSRGTGARHRRGEPDDAGAQDRRGRDAARRARPGPARLRPVHAAVRRPEGGMMTKPGTAQPDTRRRRASTGQLMDGIMGLARRLPLTRQVLADQLETATPAQMEFMHAWMNAEIDSREHSKRARLLKQAGFPQTKTLDGYDWTPLRFPVDYGRQALESLDFVEHTEDVVMFGPPGTGKTHLAIALARQACLEGVPTRFFTAAELVMRLLRANAENRLDRELSQIGRARLLVVDELGYIPIDEEGSRLLFTLR